METPAHKKNAFFASCQSSRAWHRHCPCHCQHSQTREYLECRAWKNNNKNGGTPKLYFFPSSRSCAGRGHRRATYSECPWFGSHFRGCHPRFTATLDPFWTALWLVWGVEKCQYTSWFSFFERRCIYYYFSFADLSATCVFHVFILKALFRG